MAKTFGWSKNICWIELTLFRRGFLVEASQGHRLFLLLVNKRGEAKFFFSEKSELLREPEDRTDFTVPFFFIINICNFKYNPFAFMNLLSHSFWTVSKHFTQINYKHGNAISSAKYLRKPFNLLVVWIPEKLSIDSYYPLSTGSYLDLKETINMFLISYVYFFLICQPYFIFYVFLLFFFSLVISQRRGGKEERTRHVLVIYVMLYAVGEFIATLEGHILILVFSAAQRL